MTTRETKIELERIYDKAAALREELFTLNAPLEAIHNADELMRGCLEGMSCLDSILAITEPKEEFVEKYSGKVVAFEDGEHCPYCKSFDIDNYDSDWEGDILTKQLHCNNCGLSYYTDSKIIYQNHYCMEFDE